MKGSAVFLYLTPAMSSQLVDSYLHVPEGCQGSGDWSWKTSGMDQGLSHLSRMAMMELHVGLKVPRSSKAGAKQPCVEVPKWICLAVTKAEWQGIHSGAQVKAGLENITRNDRLPRDESFLFEGGEIELCFLFKRYIRWRDGSTW